MEGLVILAGLIVIGLLVAVVVFAALLLQEMKKMSCTTSALLHNADLAQSQLQAGLAAIAHALDPHDAITTDATASATANATIEPPNEPVATDLPPSEPVATTTLPVSAPAAKSEPVATAAGAHLRIRKSAPLPKLLTTSRSLAQ